MKCPRCKAELAKTPNKEWNYRNKYYQVKSYKCPNCGKTSMIYYHDNKFSHTIPKSK
ncbi:hypothetical protein MUP77_20910 [Candidatus Bathyarchaeota archaeon]|nr:hypothetical protein [Candidatus Bathyarchaeota archaeon]